jgi:hypothetical protein
MVADSKALEHHTIEWALLPVRFVPTKNPLIEATLLQPLIPPFFRFPSKPPKIPDVISISPKSRVCSSEWSFRGRSSPAAVGAALELSIPSPVHTHQYSHRNDMKCKLTFFLNTTGKILKKHRYRSLPFDSKLTVGYLQEFPGASR